MHRAFAAWVIARPWRGFLLAAVLGVLAPQGMSPIGVLAGGIPVLLSLALSSRVGLQAALAGSAGVVAFLLANGQSLFLSIVSVAMLYWAPFGLAQVVVRTGSLSWSFQIAVLTAAAVVTAIFVGMDDATARWQEQIAAAAKQVTDAGLVTDEQLVLKSLTGTSWGTYVALGLVSVSAALFIGCWWHALQSSPGTFGREFQQLSLGKVLSAVALATVIAAAVLGGASEGVPYLDAVAWIAATGLVFQGLAAVHALTRLEPAPRKILLTTMYILLVVEPKLMTVVLSVWGVVDRWRRPSATA